MVTGIRNANVIFPSSPFDFLSIYVDMYHLCVSTLALF